MSSIYDSYATQTGSFELDHDAEIKKVARHLMDNLLPNLPRDIDIRKCRIFEFGAGWGRNLLALRRLGAVDLSGIDISVEQVKLGRQLGLTKLDLASLKEMLDRVNTYKEFDIIIAFDVLEHLDLQELYEFSRFICKYLAPGGLLIVQVPNALTPFNPVIAGDLTHYRAFTMNSLRQLFRLCEIEDIYISGIAFAGASKVRLIRGIVARMCLAPLMRLMSWVLFGRSDDALQIEPNLLGIGRATEGARK